MVESSSHGLVAMSESRLVLDFGSTFHACYEKNMFKNYAEIKKPEKVLMGNHVTANVTGKRSVEINFTSGQKLTLLNVYHVPGIKKNLMSAGLLSKRGFKIVIESDHIIVTKKVRIVSLLEKDTIVMACLD
ncbi:uncharacterized protein [Nicotiana sylvestris]|uniref:uncharacterized protein n=1 Tax=Nicotiana sylvestris TaxID=4096 RepID=UPI00388CCFCF